MKTIQERYNRISIDNKIVWEEKLSLCIKPKPKFMPHFFYKFLVSLVFVQTVERISK